MNPASLILLLAHHRVLQVCGLATALIALTPMLVVLTLTQVGAQAVSDVMLRRGAEIKPTNLQTSFGTIQLEQPAIWPIEGVVTQEFGQSNLPFQVAHTGIDIASFQGDAIGAILPGKVTFAGRAFLSGNIEVHVDHGQGLTSWYAHLSKVAVIEGQEVVQGQVIGYEGDTGWASGTHLHLEIRLFHIPVNPRELLEEGNP
jgi:murein DD-endopeptidase MepM/ murein hydrolase activator NlpD